MVKKLSSDTAKAEMKMEDKLTHKASSCKCMTVPMTSKRRTQVLMLICMDYLIGHIKNRSDYNFHHAWNTLTGFIGSSNSLLSVIDDKKIDTCIGPIPDDDSFEDVIRIGVQTLTHACYTKQWEDIGCYLYPERGVFDTTSGRDYGR